LEYFDGEFSRGEQLPPVDCLWSYGGVPLLCFESDQLSLFVRHYSCNKYNKM
jgi:hypothetical protein